MDATIVDFDKRNQEFMLYQPRQREQRLEVVHIENRGRVARIRATPMTTPIFEMTIRPHKTLASAPTQLVGKVSFDIYSDTPDYVQYVCVRFMDARNEIFQVRCEVHMTRGEWTTATFNINKDTKYESWGGNNDGKIEFPVRFNGITGRFDYRAPATNLYVDNIIFSTEQ